MSRLHPDCIQAKTDESAPSLPADLQSPYRQLQDAARWAGISLSEENSYSKKC